jgi:hypothetical protein
MSVIVRATLRWLRVARMAKGEDYSECEPFTVRQRTSARTLHICSCKPKCAVGRRWCARLALAQGLVFQFGLEGHGAPSERLAM